MRKVNNLPSSHDLADKKASLFISTFPFSISALSLELLLPLNLYMCVLYQMANNLNETNL